MSVSLSKGQKISLDKEAGSGLKEVIMGLGWDAKKSGGGGFLGGLFGGGGGGEIDLDASCVLFDDKNEMVDTIWFRQLRSKDGSITHTGDNRTGAGEGDDEQIIVDLSAVPQNVKALVFTVNSFTGQTFSQVENAFCRLVDRKSNKEIAKYNLSVQGDHTAQVMAKLYRENGAWQMQAIGENARGRTFKDLMPVLQSSL